MNEAGLLVFFNPVGGKVGGCSLMDCDAVVMKKVIRVATTAILSIELTAAFVLWLMAYGILVGERMQIAKSTWLTSAISTCSDAGVSQDTTT